MLLEKKFMHIFICFCTHGYLFPNQYIEGVDVERKLKKLLKVRRERIKAIQQ